MGFWGSLSSLLASFFGSAGWIDQKVVQVKGIIGGKHPNFGSHWNLDGAKFHYIVQTHMD